MSFSRSKYHGSACIRPSFVDLDPVGCAGALLVVDMFRLSSVFTIHEPPDNGSTAHRNAYNFGEYKTCETVCSYLYCCWRSVRVCGVRWSLG